MSHKELLERKRTDLVGTITLNSGLYSNMRSEGLIQDRQEQEFKAGGASECTQIERILDFLIKRPREDFNKFCICLEKTNQGFILEMLQMQHQDFSKQVAQKRKILGTEHCTTGTCDDQNTYRILLIGKTGTGKSATGNFLLMRGKFESKMSDGSITKVMQYGKRELKAGKHILVIDTPGFMDTNMTDAQVTTEVAKSLTVAIPGVHAVLLHLIVGRFTEDDARTLKFYEDLFGQKLYKYMIVIYTHVRDLDEDRTIEDYVRSLRPEVKNILSKCQNRYFAIDNHVDAATKKRNVQKLIERIETLVQSNSAEPYYKENFYEEAQTAMQDRVAQEMQKIQAAKDAEIRRIVEEDRVKNEKATKLKLEEQRKQHERELAAAIEAAKPPPPPPKPPKPSNAEITAAATHSCRRNQGSCSGMLVIGGRPLTFTQRNEGGRKHRWNCAITDVQTGRTVSVHRHHGESGVAGLQEITVQLFMQLSDQYA